MFLKLGKIPVVVASTPDAAKEFMKTHDAIFSTRPLSLAAKIIYKDGLGIAFTPHDNHWRQLRKICVMELLSAKRVRSFRPAREEQAFRLVQAISSTTAPLVDFGKLVSMYVADVSVHTILGRRFKDQDTLLHKVDEVVQLVGRMTPQDLFPTSFLVRALSRRTIREIEACQQSLFAFMDEVIREHLERKTHEDEDHRQENMIDVLLQIQQEGNLQFPLTMRTIEAVIFVGVC
jgi:cytochrome P450